MEINRPNYQINAEGLEQILNLVNFLREAIYEKITEKSTADCCGTSEIEYLEEISKIYMDNNVLDLKEVF